MQKEHGEKKKNEPTTDRYMRDSDPEMMPEERTSAKVNLEADADDRTGDKVRTEREAVSATCVMQLSRTTILLIDRGDSIW